jgi:hypothetical protein
VSIKILNKLSILLETYFMAWHMTYAGEYFICCWDNVYCVAFGKNLLKMSVKSIWSSVQFSSAVSLFFSMGMICPLLKIGCQNPLLLLYWDLSLNVYLFYICECSNISCICIYNYHFPPAELTTFLLYANLPCLFLLLLN